MTVGARLRTKRIPIVVAVAILTLGFVTPATAQLEVQTKWNFDNRILGEEFNRFVAVVHNPTSSVYDGTFVLFSGALQWRRQVYLSPGATQQLVFHIYAAGEGQLWTLKWGNTPDEEKPALSLFDDVPSSHIELVAAGQPAAGRQYPSALFPTSVSRMPPGLDTLVLDHVPVWSPTQEQAVLDWTYRGGTLWIRPDQWGQSPLFEGKLAVLNSAAPFSWGSGQVVHEAPPAVDLDEVPSQRPLSVAELMPSMWVENTQSQLKPELPWGGIVAVCLLYTFLICVGHFFWARHSRSLFRTGVALIATVGAASVAIFFLGQAGYDGANTLHEFVYSRPISEDRVEETRVATFFSTAGGRFTLYPSEEPQNFGEFLDWSPWRQVVSRVTHPETGTIDLPLFSSLNFIHRAPFERSAPLVEVTALPTQHRLDQARHQDVGDARYEAMSRVRLKLLDDPPPGFDAWLQLGETMMPVEWNGKEGSTRTHLYGDHSPVATVIRARGGDTSGYRPWQRQKQLPAAAPTGLELFYTYRVIEDQERNGRSVKVFRTYLHHETLMR